MKKTLFVIANNGFQDIEFGTPKKILEDNDVVIDIASGKKGKCVGKFGLEVAAGYSLEEIHGDDYDAVVFIGGPGAAAEYTGHPEYFRLAREARVLAAICIAPTVLSDAGVLRGKRVTGWDSNGMQRRILEKNGATWTGGTVAIDGNIVTANGPEAAEEFGGAILAILKN